MRHVTVAESAASMSRIPRATCLLVLIALTVSATGCAHSGPDLVEQGRLTLERSPSSFAGVCRIDYRRLGSSAVCLSKIKRPLEIVLSPPLTSTVRGSCNPSAACFFNSRNASRARCNVAKGPPVFSVFGAGSFPLQESSPSVATKNVAGVFSLMLVPRRRARQGHASHCYAQQLIMWFPHNTPICGQWRIGPHMGQRREALIGSGSTFTPSRSAHATITATQYLMKKGKAISNAPTVIRTHIGDIRYGIAHNAKPESKAMPFSCILP